ncbi:MAG: AAA family ATPase [Colwellia sp.]|nr:AAA family ATPase [Colwellia sp.]MCW9080220.1 AAA family ATPase [Colwellia sp.]
MQTAVNNILARIESVVLGKPQECRLALACLLAQGHLLIEDLPGMGKTTLAHVLASTLGLSYQRTQFTSDLLPADIIGISIFNRDTNNFELHKGPIFSQVVLADEINRASPKTQSALLEAMAEQQVSIDGETYDLPAPFFVIATQNPLFHAGTYPLPESQLDRFMMRISLGFPDISAEKKILLGNNDEQISRNKGDLQAVTAEELTLMQKHIQQIHVADDVINYIIALCQVTRGQIKAKESDISCKPLSPRAGKALLAASKAWAFINNREFVLPDDVQAVFSAVCQHRMELTAQDYNATNAALSTQIIQHVDVLKPLK